MDSEELDIVKFSQELRDAVDWVEQLGIRVEATRFMQYIKQLQKVTSTPGLSIHPDDPQFESVLEAFESGEELISIHQELSGFKGKEFLHRVRLFVKGTYLQRKEYSGSSSNQARNLGFELLFAARLVRGGIKVELPEYCDLQTTNPEVRIECKRPQSSGKVEAALRAARKQLEAAPGSGSSINLIAVSIGKILHQGSKYICKGDPQRVAESIESLLLDFRDQHQHIWCSKPFSNITGIWFQYSVMIVFPGIPIFNRIEENRIIMFRNDKKSEHKVALDLLIKAINKNNGSGPV